jgi:raffinose/stachyose/melibiose transport system substrate-binding protein
MKKILALMVVFLLVVSAFAGCGSNNSSADNNSEAQSNGSQDSSPNSDSTEKTELTFWELSSKQEALEQMVEEFNSTHSDIEVTVSYFEVDGIKDSLKVAASSNTLPNMWFNWGGSLGGFYAENDLIYDLSDYADSHGWYDLYNPGALNLCTLDGKLAGYPRSYNTIGMYYRTDIFEEYGLEVPTTFEEFENVCAVLKENGITPISTAGLNGWHVMRFVELLVEHYAGAEKHDALNTFATSWDDEDVVQALTKYEEFVEKGYLPEGFVTFDPNDTQLLTFSGQAAMDIQGPWYDGNIISEGQDMEDYDTFAFPSGGTNRMSAFVEMIQLNANNSEAEVDASIEFLNFYYSDENTEKYSDIYNLPLPKKGAPMPEGMPNVENLLSMSGENGTFTITDQAFVPQVADALFDVQDAIATDAMTPEEGAKTIQAAIEDYFAQQ